MAGEATVADDLDTGTFDAPVSDALAEFMQRGWGRQADPVPPPAPPAEATRSRRDRLRAAFPGETLVICAGQPARRNGDQYYPFRAESDYVWLTGDQTPGGVLVLAGGLEALYVPPPSRRDEGEFWRNARHGELWVGRRATLATRSVELGIECRPLGELAELLERIGTARHLPGVDTDAIAALRDTDEHANRALRAVLSELRLVKDSFELAQLRAAIDATTAGFTDVARLLRAGPAVTERGVECAFDARARQAGQGVGYHTIAAAGEHAATLHWNRNDGPVQPGMLLLLDAGAETGSLYTADITRTMPANGRFTPLQRDVYEIVLAAQDAGIRAVRPGQPFRGFYRECARVLAEGLAGLGVLPVDPVRSLEADSELHRRWTLCSPGHMLGLDVHDCGSARAPEYLDGVLQPGQVLTVEPGLYFQANDELVPAELRGMGVRIEDDVLVTDTGCELLSRGLPRTVQAVEEWLAEAGKRP